MYYTLTRVGANITIARYLARDEDNYRALPPKVPTYYIQACSHNRVGIVIYIMGVGGGRRQEGASNPVLVPVRSVTEYSHNKEKII